MHSDRPFVFVIFAVSVVRVHPVVLTPSFKLLSFCIYLCRRKDLGDISNTSRVITVFVLNFVAVATGSVVVEFV